MKYIIRSPGLGDTSITWVSIGRPSSTPVTADDRKDEYESYELLYLPQECGLCLEAMHRDDKTIASTQNNPPFPAIDQRA